MRRAKIICTIGPASQDPSTIEQMIDAGMDVARLNFAHGPHDDQRAAFATVREASQRTGKNIAILQDLQGPKIRVGTIPEGHVPLGAGQRFILTSDDLPGDSERASTTYPELARDVTAGDTLLLSDGLLTLTVLDTTDTDVMCEVVHGGELREHAGVNLPGVRVSSPALTRKDEADLAFGLQLGVDWVALSFVRSAEDVLLAKQAIRAEGSKTPVIAKLEKPQAVDALDDILAAADGIMIARGDLGVEIAPERVPVVQKGAIRAANQAKLPVITATQMLDSMTHHPRPTRAEVSDVANAIYDGTDAVMLSGETAIGEYPVETVALMDRIIREAERDNAPRSREYHVDLPTQSVPEAIAEAVSEAASDLGVELVVGFTQSGDTARLLSKYRPDAPVVVFALEESIKRRLALLWGVEARLLPLVQDTEQLLGRVEEQLLTDGSVREGSLIAIVAGCPLAAKGPTNMMTLRRVVGA